MYIHTWSPPMLKAFLLKSPSQHFLSVLLPPFCLLSSHYTQSPFSQELLLNRFRFPVERKLSRDTFHREGHLIFFPHRKEKAPLLALLTSTSLIRIANGCTVPTTLLGLVIVVVFDPATIRRVPIIETFAGLRCNQLTACSVTFLNIASCHQIDRYG